uniref:Snurportin-1 n=1 Tax=Panagrolaimus sp. ES5 TaxID=591445 RepID=A0AC34FMB8_9BILA
MLSEWLIDIPNELHGSWTMVASPKGKRCIVVAKGGITKIYSKYGYCLDKFKTCIPGGGDDANGKTILDCIKNGRKFFILDVIFANQKAFYEVEAIKRFEEIKKIVKNILANNEKSTQFSEAPRCSCNNEEMTKMMSEPLGYEISGLLFYNNDGWYTSGYTPLVGWLEPWMLPEVINIQIHESYNIEKKNALPLKEYVEDFNNKHNHHYVN